MTDEATQAMDDGLAAQDPIKHRERADVKRWLDRCDRARAFDEPAREQYAMDRRYARGDSGAEVDANLIGTFVDILAAFLYAKDPDVDVAQARCMEPPSLEAMRDSVEDLLAEDPMAQAQIAQQAQQIAMQAQTAAAEQAVMGLVTGQPPMPQPPPEQAMAMAMEQAREEYVQAQFEALQKRYAKRQRDNKAFAETLELVVSRLWRDGRLKHRARPCVRSALTIGVGWLKSSWQERMGQDPVVRQQIADLQDNLRRVVAQQQAMEDESGDELEASKAALERELASLNGQAERVIARGLAIDFCSGEEIQVAPGVAIANYIDAPWIEHRIPMLAEDATAEFKLSPERARGMTRYAARKPVMKQNEAALLDEASAADAEAFTSNGTGESGDRGDQYVMVREIWDRDTGHVLTAIDGLKEWVKPPYQPKATSRFYPFFLMTMGEMDGQRHPQSPVTRSAKLVDEYNRIGSAEAEHRRRVKPKMLFLRGQIGHDSMTEVTQGETGEYVGIETTQPNADLSRLFLPAAYPQLDPNLYSRERIVGELERVWGIQEALSQVSTAKTATEASIQQSGFQARTGSQRDTLEDMLSELALYTAEVAWANLKDEDVRRMVGPDAMWPEYVDAESLATMVNVDIRGGSSGKPNTAAERQAWATLLPTLQGMIGMIGQMRGSDPMDVADSYEELLRITAERAGERIDLDQLIPPAGPAPMIPPPGAVPPGAPGEPAPMPEAPQPPEGVPDPALAA